MNAVSVVQQEEQTANNARLVRDVIVSTAMFVVNNISLVDEEVSYHNIWSLKSSSNSIL